MVVGSATLATVLASLGEALRWTDPEGFWTGMVAGMILMGIPMILVLLCAQAVLVAVLMSRGRRAWWRTLIVLSPAAFAIGSTLQSIAGLYPPEKRAQRELPHHLGGPIPPSGSDFTIKFSGGMDPSWSFSFKVSPQDYEAIRKYRNYVPAPSDSSDLVWLQFPGDGQLAHTTYYLGYDAAKSRCVLTSVNY